uniref:BRI1 kinase inhibitor 1-like n=1 Tax=Erigeron canadensis TaxID=72917 RepID=UPI001CB8DD3A|nr:BRI1 kinase inhibitor 1-like [Erigeron canadensis]
MEIIDMNDKVIDYFNKQDFQENNQNPSSPPTTTSPPSPSTSPTHEFSFTISLHHHPQPRAAIDLSPADDIFFQGHLLPLHFPISSSSPRSSTNSMDSYTLPMNLLYNNIDQINNNNNLIGNTSFHCHHQTTYSEDEHDVSMTTTHQNHPKSKSFSIFNIPKWKKRVDDDAESEKDHYFNQSCQNRETSNKKLKLDHLSQLIKRYMKMVKPALLSFQKPNRKRPSNNNREFKHHQSYSYSGNSIRSKQQQEAEKSRRGRFSAPASMRTSPANSGILVASGNASPSNYKNMTSGESSSMEELHAAIQAAIAHCKNSIAMDTKI